MDQKKQSSKAALRRRWRAMLADGSIASLGSEGRLVAHYVVYAADWSTCELRASMRHMARFLCVQPTTVRRGVSQLLEAGVLCVVAKPDGSGRTRYAIPERAQGVRAPDTQCAQGRARGVSTPDTQCARAAHKACPERARPVRSARTLCARKSVYSSGSSVTSTVDTSQASPGDGFQPPPARHPQLSDGLPASEQEARAGPTSDGQSVGELLARRLTEGAK